MALLIAAALVISPFPKAAAAPTPAKACSEPNAAAGIACEIARGIALAKADRLVVVASLPTSDRALRDGEGLSALITRLVAGRIGSTAEPRAPTSLAVARGVARAAGKLLYLEVELRQGVLEVSADLHDVKLGFWDRIARPAMAPIGHAFARRRIDAEVGRFLDRPPLVSISERAFAGPAGVLALACGDTDDDGSLELVVVTRQRIQVGRLRDDRFVVERDARWSELAPIAGVPLREPIASARILDGGIHVGISDRQHALRLATDLATSPEPLDGQIPLDDVLCLSVDGVALGHAEACRTTQAPPRGSTLPTVDAFDARRIVAADGLSKNWRVVRRAGTHDLVIEPGTGAQPHRASAVGAQVAVGDIDLDGAPELLTSLPVQERAKDALVISTVTRTGVLDERLRHPVPLGVDAVTVCPPEQTAHAQVVVATGDRLVVLQ